jgi:YjbR
MPTEKDFRRIALGMKDAVESAHMGHPDFRLNGKIFATLHTDRLWGMVKLPPEQQERFVRQYPSTFAPESGAWGRSGCTAVHLKSVDEETLGEALTLAWQNTARERPSRGTRLQPRPQGRQSKPSKPSRRVRPSRKR